MLRTGLKGVNTTEIKFLTYLSNALHYLEHYLEHYRRNVWGKKAEGVLALILISSELDCILKSQVYTLVYKEANNYESAPVTTVYGQTAC